MRRSANFCFEWPQIVEMHPYARMLPDLARFGGQFPRSGSFSRCGDLVSRSGQIWSDLARSGNLGNFFFQKKKNPPRSGQIWPDLEIWPFFFFFSQISGYCLPGKGTLEFFFSPLKRANFDDLRPFKAKFGTFEHLWGSKTWFCEPEISWFLPKTSRFLKNLEKKNFFFPGKFCPLSRVFVYQKVQKNARVGCFDDLVPPYAVQGPTISTFS